MKYIQIYLELYFYLHLCVYVYVLTPKYYQKEIWSNTSVLYDKHFIHDFGSMLGAENQFQVLL